MDTESSLQKYRAFVATVDAGSFTLAAERMGYTQSGVSRMVADLERSWGQPLLERGRKGVALTSSGQELLPYVRGVCDEDDRLRERVDQERGLATGLLRIGTISSVATHWIPKMVRAFKSDYPGIAYELLLGDYTELESWLESGRVDCAFVRLPTRGDFDVLPLADDELVAVLPECHELAEFGRVPAIRLCDYPFMSLAKDGDVEDAGIFDAIGTKPDIRFSTWDDYSIMSMVESGLGVSVLPRLILRRVPYRIAVRGLEPASFRKIGFALRDRERASLAVRRFMEYLDCRDDD